MDASRRNELSHAFLCRSRALVSQAASWNVRPEAAWYVPCGGHAPLRSASAAEVKFPPFPYPLSPPKPLLAGAWKAWAPQHACTAMVLRARTAICTQQRCCMTVRRQWHRGRVCIGQLRSVPLDPPGRWLPGHRRVRARRRQRWHRRHDQLQPARRRGRRGVPRRVGRGRGACDRALRARLHRCQRRCDLRAKLHVWLCQLQPGVSSVLLALYDATPLCVSFLNLRRTFPARFQREHLGPVATRLLAALRAWRTQTAIRDAWRSTASNDCSIRRPAFAVVADCRAPASLEFRPRSLVRPLWRSRSECRQRPGVHATQDTMRTGETRSRACSCGRRPSTGSARASRSRPTASRRAGSYFSSRRANCSRARWATASVSAARCGHFPTHASRHRRRRSLTPIARLESHTPMLFCGWLACPLASLLARHHSCASQPPHRGQGQK